MAKFYARIVLTAAVLFVSSVLLVIYASWTDSGDGATFAADIGNSARAVMSSTRNDNRINRSYPRRITLATDDNGTVQVFSWYETKKAKQLCAMVNYTNTPLPQMSVIICFHGKESISNLLHTIHGVFQRTPSRLLKELILIDDFSRNDDFGVFLELYVAAIFDNKVRILRNTERLGLIRSRLKGIRAATGVVVVVLDSHVEVQPGWAEPLLSEIHANPKTLAASYIDWMERKGGTWKYRHGGTTWKTYFDWTFVFGWQTMAEAEVKAMKSLIEPIRAPVIIGTIFAIRKDYFFEVGAFDEDMQLWGGENLDLPVRVWLCGGRVVNVPCSRAGHMENLGNRNYRLSPEWDLNKNRNYKRFAEVWAGEFKKYFYMYTPNAQAADEGNTSERMKLHSVCTKNFSWYLQEVFPELGMPDRDSLAWGYLKNQGSGDCLDTRQSSVPGQAECGPGTSTQAVYWSKWFHLRFPIHLLNYNDKPPPGMTQPGLYMAEYISLHNTDYGSKYFHAKDGPIIEVTENKCLDGSIPNQLYFATCKNNSAFQNWRFQHYTDLYSALMNKNSTDPQIKKRQDKYSEFYERVVPGLRSPLPLRTVRSHR